MATQSSSPKELTTNDLAVICNALNDVAPKCFELGLQLGVRKANIDIIMKNNKDDCQAQLREIISERLKQDSPLTWHDIVRALRSPSVNHPDLARHIESWYISPLKLTASDPQQHLSLGGERPYPMVMMGLSTPMISVPTSSTRDRISVPTCSLCEACFKTIIKPAFSCLLCQLGSSHRENYHPPTQMMGQTPLRGPSHGENYQPPTQMMGQTPLRGPSHGENYQPPTQMMGQTPLRGPPHGENYQSIAILREPEDIRLPDSVSLRSHYTCLPHHMQPDQTGYPNTLSTTQPCPSIQTRGSSATAHHRSPMETFVHYVKSTYKQSEIEKNLNVLKWPPTPSKIFINLACIDWESVVSKEEADEYTRAMVEDGNVDAIMKKKTNIDFSDIVQDLPPVAASEKVVLVEGAPGVGKSTFAWEFCRRWERGEIAQQYQLVLLLRLRDERMSRAKCLRDLIYHSSESMCQAVVEELEFTSGVNTLIILEGFDELSDCQRKEPSIFLELILGHLLLHATIMITSRPWATGALLARFKHRVFLHVEILGFTEENITKYVTSVFTGEGKKTASPIDPLSVGGSDEVSKKTKKNIDDVMAYLGKYPQIKACMYIPLNAAIVVSIYRESMKSKWVLPTTLTELYQALTRILLLRYLRGHAEYSHQKLNVESFEDLPREVYSQLFVINKIAYDGVCKEGGKEVQLIFPDIPDDFETLGLMQSVSQLFMDGQKTSHNFLHLTFQEFLAAFLISSMSPAEQLKHFQRHKDGRLRVVLRFLAGLTKLNNVTPDQLRSLLGKPTVEQNDEHLTPYCNPMRPDVCVSPHHTNWLFEAQNSELLQSLFHNHTASFTFTRGMLPLEYYSVGYCIAHSHSKWSLTLDEDKEEEKLHMLVSGVKTGNDHHRVTLRITSAPEKMHIIINGLSPCVETMYLKVTDNHNSLSLPPSSTLHILELQIDDNKSPFNISCDLSFSSLEALIISSSCKGTVTLGAKTCKNIGNLLSSSTSLKEVHLSQNIRNGLFSMHVSIKDMEVITKGLSDNVALPLKTLDIDCMCTFTTTATRSLVQFITRSTTLQCLKIHINKLEDVDIFAKGLSDNTALPLKSLDIECKCTFTASAMQCVLNAISRINTLQHVKIVSNTLNISDKHLDIDCKCTFTIAATKSLAEFIARSTTLQNFKIHVDYFKQVHLLSKCLSDNIDLPLESLDIDCKCTFTTTATRSLVQFITRSTSLQYIRICHVTFSVQGLTELTEAIHHCSRLQKKLEKLSFHVVHPKDVVNLSYAMKGYPGMQNSITEWDGVTNAHSFPIGLEALLISLGLGCSQDIINLMSLSISDGVMVALAQALHHNSTLKKLNLSNNCISDGGAVALAQALHHNSTLKELNLSGNDAIGKEGTHQLVQALTVNTSITKVWSYGGGLILPVRCEEYATQCTQYNTVKNRIWFQ